MTAVLMRRAQCSGWISGVEMSGVSYAKYKLCTFRFTDGCTCQA